MAIAFPLSSSVRHTANNKKHNGFIKVETGAVTPQELTSAFQNNLTKAKNGKKTQPLSQINKLAEFFHQAQLATSCLIIRGGEGWRRGRREEGRLARDGAVGGRVGRHLGLDMFDQERGGKWS